MGPTDDASPQDGVRPAVTFGPASRQAHAVMIRTLHPGSLGLALRIMFGMTIYVTAAGVIAKSI